jgi:hypothetical protein
MSTFWLCRLATAAIQPDPYLKMGNQNNRVGDRISPDVVKTSEETVGLREHFRD